MYFVKPYAVRSSHHSREEIVYKYDIVAVKNKEIIYFNVWLLCTYLVTKRVWED